MARIKGKTNRICPPVLNVPIQSNTVPMQTATPQFSVGNRFRKMTPTSDSQTSSASSNSGSYNQNSVQSSTSSASSSMPSNKYSNTAPQHTNGGPQQPIYNGQQPSVYVSSHL